MQLLVLVEVRLLSCFPSQVSSQSKMSSGVPNQLSLLARIVEQIELSPLAVTGRGTQVREKSWLNHSSH